MTVEPGQFYGGNGHPMRAVVGNRNGRVYFVPVYGMAEDTFLATSGPLVEGEPPNAPTTQQVHLASCAWYARREPCDCTVGEP